MKITEIDKNFKIASASQKDGIVFYDVENQPFRIYGLAKENGTWRRMPQKVAHQVSEGVYALHTHTAGGRVRFVTNSSFVAVRTQQDGIGVMPHMALSGSAGFDVYTQTGSVAQRYRGTFVPPSEINGGYESVVCFEETESKTVTIYFPLYSNVSRLEIGLSEHAMLKEAPDYTIEKPIVYYGSSITQGGCASRPGSAYQSILSRRFDCNYINLGFSGAAKAEDMMTEYIQGLKMSLFVMDYDHNSPSLEHLKNTHERMYLKIREAQPQLPIILLPRPKRYLNKEETLRKEIIEKTYQKAKDRGDKRIYYIDHKELTDLAGDDGLVDNCHPTDSGFLSMANALSNVIGELFQTNHKQD